MLTLIDGFKSVYPFLNEELLIAGIILHDICKIVELSNYAGPEYTKEGKLLGHITMGVKAIEVSAYKQGYQDTEEVLLLQHMILSHHYYGNYGSPKKTNIPEALILHFIDNIDSKMTVLKETLDQTEKGEFTTPIGVLDREKYYKSKL
jgi:3'-5' exoribonuclease